MSTAVQKPKTDNLTLENVTRIAYSALREYASTVLFDGMADWHKAEERVRQDYLAKVAYLLANPGAPPSILHSLWMNNLLIDGWRRGAITNPAKKEHARLMPFELLPQEEQMKDRLLVSVVNALRQV